MAIMDPFRLLVGAFALLCGALFVFRGWQMRFRKRTDLIVDWDRNPISDAPRYANAFSMAYALAGVAFSLLALAVVLEMHFGLWGILVGAVFWCLYAAIDFIAGRAARRAAAFGGQGTCRKGGALSNSGHETLG
jgi:hypothetical protein